jgi:hypothetical protein
MTAKRAAAFVLEFTVKFSRAILQETNSRRAFKANRP